MAVQISLTSTALLPLLLFLKVSFASHGLGEANSFTAGGAHSELKVGQALPDFIDPNGYVLYCPCMGRFGNQAEQFLGTLAFVRDLNRTFVVPPFVIYPPEAKKNSERVEFKRWFNLKPVNAIHRSISMEEFFKKIAPVVWPKEARIGHCMYYAGRDSDSCSHKNGNPFGPFWDHFGVDFVGDEQYSLPYSASDSFSRDQWLDRFPADKYPVIALPGAVGRFPSDPSHWSLQKAFQWSYAVNTKVKKFIKERFNDEKYVGIHLRNGVDWESACRHIEGRGIESYMASPQCTHGTDLMVTREMCLPSESVVLKEVKEVVKKTKVSYLYVASDSDPMVKKLTKYLKQLKVTVVTNPAEDLRMDLALLQRSEHFIGNCVSSVSSFVTRHRRLYKRPTSFWSVKR